MPRPPRLVIARDGLSEQALQQLPTSLRPAFAVLTPARIAGALSMWHVALFSLSHSRVAAHNWHDFDSVLGFLHMLARVCVSFVFAVGARARASAESAPRAQRPRSNVKP